MPDLVKIINGDESNEVLVLQGEVGPRDNPAWDLYILLLQPGPVPPGTGRQKVCKSSGKTQLLAVWRVRIVSPNFQPHFITSVSQAVYDLSTFEVLYLNFSKDTSDEFLHNLPFQS